MNASPRPLPVIEAVVYGVLVLSAVALHGLNFANVGALWRDECSVFQLSTMPTLSEVWAHMHLDSVPLMLVLILRTLDAVGLSSDTALRFCGVIVGLGGIAVMTLNARQMGYGFPFVTLGLLALSPSVIRWGDGVRPYGLAVLTVLLTLGLAWRYAVEPSRGGLVALAVSTLLTVHIHYSNSVFILAILSSAALVCAVQRAWRRGIEVLAVGAVAAASMLIYLGPLAKEHTWYPLVTGDRMELAFLIGKLREALTPAVPWTWAAWLVVGGVATVLLLVSIAYRGLLRVSERQRLAAVYALSTLVLAAGCYGSFLMSLKYITFPWYYLVLMAVAATSFEVGFGMLANFPLGRLVRVAVPVALLVTTWAPARDAVRTRITNVDHIAQFLNKQAQPNDYIIAYPFNVAITFNRYFTGRAGRETVPPMFDHRVHRYDEFLRQMRMPNPSSAVDTLVQHSAAALQGGGRVWVIGDLQYPTTESAQPYRVGQAGPTTWDMDPYEVMWTQITGSFLHRSAARVTRLDTSLPWRLSGFETLSLTMYEGWRRAP